jgi:hypothetical protein
MTLASRADPRDSGFRKGSERSAEMVLALFLPRHAERKVRWGQIETTPGSS